MLVRSLRLQNIRSYNSGDETVLEVPEGVVLFEGDIGSGKSTLLYALEFALFGFSDLRGPHLLSEGRQTGKVGVTFESGGLEYSVDRHLKARGHDIVQAECYISSNGERTRLSPSDLKERIVSILGFNEPTHPRAESLVYRYAVFTPQEQMKDILVQDSEDRMHVIRRILGAQNYQVASENSETVERAIREMARGLRKASEDLQDKKQVLESTIRVLSELEVEIPRLKRAEVEASKLVLRLDGEWKEYLGQKEALTRAQDLIPRLRQEASDLSAEKRENEHSLRRLEAQLADEVEPIIAKLGRLTKPRSSSKELRSQLDAEKQKAIQLADAKSSLEADLSKTSELVSKGVCPFCGQSISGDYSDRLIHSQLELARVEGDLKAAAESVAEAEETLRKAEDYEAAESDHARAAKDSERVNAEMVAARKKLQQVIAKLATRNNELDGATSRVRDMSEISGKLESLERELNRAREQDKQSSLRLNQAQSDLANAGKDRARLESEVRKMQEEQAESFRLSRYQTWLSSFFRPTIRIIENQTLMQAASRFNEHFQRFFTLLVDDPDMVVRVREDFTPVFEREGFEQDFEALSGGERTSMALAYRFALNSVVRESILTQPELVILDEPTDGFSREQVYKMRGLLEQLASRQVILVSHEKELESMADHIFRVEKEGGSSRVVKLNP